jgi:Na+/H+-dicarboxylate symporter
MQLSTKVLIGLGLGIFTGIFLGEQAAFLKIFGDIFIMVLQMVILPYIMFSIISGLGGLTVENALLLAKKGIWVFLVLWLLGLFMVMIMPMAFPDWEMASFPEVVYHQKRVALGKLVGATYRKSLLLNANIILYLLHSSVL